MTRPISMLNNIFPLHTKMEHYHFKYPNALCQMSLCKYFYN